MIIYGSARFHMAYIWKGVDYYAHLQSMDLELGTAQLTFSTKGFQLPLLRKCGGALKACILYKHIVDMCEDFIGSTVLAGACINDCHLRRSHEKLARMFFEAAG